MLGNFKHAITLLILVVRIMSHNAQCSYARYKYSFPLRNSWGGQTGAQRSRLLISLLGGWLCRFWHLSLLRCICTPVPLSDTPSIFSKKQPHPLPLTKLLFYFFLLPILSLSFCEVTDSFNKHLLKARLLGIAQK